MKKQSINLTVVGTVLGALLLCLRLATGADAAGAEAATSEATSNDSDESAESSLYAPPPENLAARNSFQDAKFGIFIHWGVYSALGRGEWVMQIEKIPISEYEKLPPRFNPTKYDAAEWVSLFKRSGAEYVTITSKHHDGFCMWDSKATDWDIVDRTPYKRDVLKPLADECSRQGLKLFFYYSQLDWHHPEYFPRGITGHYGGRPERGDWNKYLAYMDAQLSELLSGDYGQVAGIWFDGWWDQQSKRFEGHKDAEPRETIVNWHLRRTYDLIHSLQPAALIGANHHVAPFEGEDFQMFERDLPGENKGGHSPDSKIGDLPLETCDTINGAWGYNASDKKYKSVKQLVHYLVQAAGRNANFLLNIGPRPDGTIDPEMVKRLEGIGEWMSQYGDSIRGTRGGPTGPQPWGTSTQSADTVYLHILDTSAADANGWLTLTGTDALKASDLRELPGDAAVDWRRDAAGQFQVKIVKDSDAIDTVLKVAKSNHQ